MRFFDLATIAIYLIAITWFGAHFRKSQRDLKDYFLGGRNAPWWAIALSIVSAETSTLTVIGTPALSFSGNFQFLQLVLGYLLARIVISALFLPKYFRGEMFTAYELMRRRFGERIRRLTAGTFLVLRALAEGVRSNVPSDDGVSEAPGTPVQAARPSWITASISVSCPKRIA